MCLEDFGLVPHECKTVSAGDTFGHLTILAIGKKPGTYRYAAVCQCSCGSPPSAIRLDGIVSGAVVACGCVQKERTTTHGLTKHPLYNVWKKMLIRCTDPTVRSYKDYGGRGIQVCDRWQSIENFVADMENGYEPGLEIDRVDNDGNYEPSNCRWATRQQNCDNRRTGRNLTYNGRTQSLKAWATELGIGYAMLYERIDVWNWDAHRALTTPAIDKHERMAIARAARWGRRLA